MRITLNGDSHDCDATHLDGLLATLGLLDKRIAVEFNQIICPRSQWPSQPIADGDVIEIVHAIGGG